MTTTFTQEEINSICYQPFWYNMGIEDRAMLQAILEDYIDSNTDDYLVDDAKHLLEIVQNPIIKKFKDVIHCGVSH